MMENNKGYLEAGIGLFDAWQAPPVNPLAIFRSLISSFLIVLSGEGRLVRSGFLRFPVIPEGTAVAGG